MGHVRHLAGLSLSGPPRHAAHLPCKSENLMKSPRFWIIIVLLISTIFVLQSRGDVDRVPPSEPLSLMPRNFGPWTAQDFPLTEYIQSVVGQGKVLGGL